MALTPKHIDSLLKMLQQTREAEMSCPECLDHLDVYTQRVLDGDPIEGVLVSVGQHLQECPFCIEEFNLIVETLKSIQE